MLGKFFVKKEGPSLSFYMITELEVYDGFEDKASHASRGRTSRNEVMFRQGGCFYVYLIYGLHYMLNIVTGDREYPAAILLRGSDRVSGPGRLSKELGIDKTFNNRLIDESDSLWLEDRGVRPDKKDIQSLPRIGVDYAGEEWRKKKLRFLWLT